MTSEGKGREIEQDLRIAGGWLDNKKVLVLMVGSPETIMTPYQAREIIKIMEKTLAALDASKEPGDMKEQRTEQRFNETAEEDKKEMN